jgi:predicted permease
MAALLAHSLVGVIVMLESIGHDLRYAARSLRRSPGVTFAAVVTLALGIGANTAIFSVVDEVLLKTMPVRDPQQLYFLAHGTGENPAFSSTYPLLERYRTLRDVFTGITAYMTRPFKISTPAGSELVEGQFVSGNYHDVLGVPLILGRGFTSDPDRPNDGSAVAVVSESYWSRRFARDAHIVGKTIGVDGKTFTIVGVTAAGFRGLRPGTRFDITLPISALALENTDFLTTTETWRGLNMVARLRPGLVEAQAERRVDDVFQRYMSEPEQAWNWRGGRLPDGFRVARLVPAARGTPVLRIQYDRPLRVLMGMVGVLLLIACVNVANLLLVQASARMKEVAIRMSVGAGRVRLMRQFLTESLLLSLSGGAAGLLVSLWATTAIVSLFAGGRNPIVLDLQPDGRLLAFTAFVSALTGILFGLMPSLRATRTDVAPLLKENAGSATAGRRRVGAGKVLAASQIALCIVLLAGTGLLVRSLHNLKSVDAGFRKDNVLLFYLDTRGTASEVVDLYPGLLDRLQAIPGVRAAAFSTSSPLGTDANERPIEIPSLPRLAEPRRAWSNLITPDYFTTLGITVLRGRGLTPQDSSNAPKVAVINETMARAYFPESDPVGRTFVFRAVPDDRITIVGVVRDARQQNLRDPSPRMAYVPIPQGDEPPSLLTAAIRTTQSPRSLEALVRNAVSQHSPDLTLSYMRTMEEQVDARLVPERVLATLSTGFGVLALLLSCIGLYGVVSYDVARRAREIGIRIALGAQRSMVLRHTMTDTLRICVAGVVIGLAVALAATRVVSTFLFGLSPRDPLTLLSATAVLVVTALLAGYLPARRAATTDPVRALRME